MNQATASPKQQKRALKAQPSRNSGLWLVRLFQAALILFVVAAAGWSAWWYWLRPAQTIVLTVGAGPLRSDSYELMSEIAEVVNRQPNGVELKIIPTRDSSSNITLLNSHKVDLATVRADTPVVSDVRLVAELFTDYFQLIVRRDSGIVKIPGLNGRKVAVPQFGTDEFRSFWVIGDHYDLPIDGVEWQAMPFQQAAKAILNGEIDAIFTVRSLRDRLLLNLFEDAQLKRIALDYVPVEQAKAISVKRPFLEAGTIPKGSLSGFAPTPNSDVVTSAIERVLVSRDDVDPNAIAELTRILFEHRFELIIRFALASAVRQPDTSEGVAVPLHEGASWYYDRNEPSFLQENSEQIALLLTIGAMLFSGLLALRSRLMVRQKNRIDSYNHVLLNIAERAATMTTVKEISELRGELFAVLEKVVRALDADDITEEGFQSFSLLHNSVRDMLIERSQNL